MIIRDRLLNQGIASGLTGGPAGVVASMGAVQAQDYSSALWAIGLRSPGSTEQDVERVVAERKIIRTWPMRGTLHFVAADDVRWMQRLLTPRVLAGTARRVRELELDDATFAKSRKVLTRALQGGRCLTREAVLEHLEKAGISPAGGRGYHILFRLAQEELICFGPRSGKAHTFVLLDEWVPSSWTGGREESLAKLALRYFSSHGPATLQDFVWWSGLAVTDARAGIAGVSGKLARARIAGVEHWGPEETPVEKSTGDAVRFLPAFDEYLLGYRDRGAVLDPVHSGKVNPGNNGVFMPTVLLRGRVVATWKRVVRKKTIAVTVQPFVSLRKTDRAALQAVAQHHARFLGVESAEVA